jgi:RNA polymerase sigma factor (sigma-70 family)
LTEEQRELVTRYMPMAQRLARQAVGGWLHADDLESEAYAALVEAARSFDPANGTNFALYARPRILGTLRDYRRFLCMNDRTRSAAGCPVFERVRITDDLPGRILGKEPEGPLGDASELHEAVEAVIRRLPRLEAVACRLLYVEGKSHDEAAEALGCSKGHLYRIHSGAMERLRRHYGEALAG